MDLDKAIRELTVPDVSGKRVVFSFSPTEATDGKGGMQPWRKCDMCGEGIRPDWEQLRLHALRHIHILPHEHN